MMGSIRITSTPPGPAPEHIRKQWVGIEIPLATQADIDEDPPSDFSIGSENVGGHLVLREEAVEALRAAGRHEAAIFWATLLLGRYLRFNKEVCEPA